MSNKPVYCRIVRISVKQAAEAIKARRLYVKCTDGVMRASILENTPQASRSISNAINHKGLSCYFIKTSR